jgi:hypothetical protein
MRSTLGFSLTIVLAAFAPLPSANAVVPPDNSAVTQYTESFPTGAGEAPTGGTGRQSPPQEVVGGSKTPRLKAQGEEGAAVEELAAKTSPSGVEGAGGSDGRREAGEKTADRTADGGGNSGVGEVLGQASGTSSGTLGLLLPLVIVVALLGSTLYAVRRRQQSA